MKIINYNVDKVQKQMDLIVQDSEIIGSILCSEEGLIIIDTFNYNSIYNSETIAAMAASMMFSHTFGFIPPNEIILTYDNEKVIIRKVFSKKKNLEFLLITIVPSKLRYFRRHINKLAKIIQKNI